ncbi:hypothetical protein CBR_g21179 [Chara braunii]|uniref:Uncharacterized protein n=1 Tax=Chara braunii TaxID=69332 RepID=A0A388L0W2_CHABU|nr:hypothetical protein CBR_g21179 [Chara braunii]|eukprot:GBG75937.1 hypothetical protein CBR_g21179 [Chara braunii]
MPRPWGRQKPQAKWKGREGVAQPTQPGHSEPPSPSPSSSVDFSGLLSIETDGSSSRQTAEQFDRKPQAMEEIQEKDNPVLGIDLGTSHCCVALFRTMDDIEIVPNEHGRRTTPSYVAWDTEDNRLVGEAAKKHGMNYPGKCIFEVKRLMGRSFRDANVQEDAKMWPFDVIAGPHGEAVVKVPDAPRGGQSTFKPEDVSAVLLKKMKQIAEEYTNRRSIADAVITVPAYFNHSQRKATMAAGVSAGLRVLRLMSEPTAAALAYGHQRMIGRGPSAKKLVAFHLGGGSFDASVMTVKVAGPEDQEIQDCSFVVNAVAGDSHLGGIDMDKRLLRHVADKLKSQIQGEDLLGNPWIVPRLNEAVVDAKHVLSVRKETEIKVHYRGDVLSLRLRRSEFEMLNQDLFERMLRIVEQALQDSKFRKEEISAVLLSGGSTVIPKVREMLTAFFGKPPIKSVNADEAVAFGAALQAGLLARRRGGKCAEATSITVQDVTSTSIGVLTRFDIMRVVVPRNSPLPASGSMKYTLLDDQESLWVPLYEGERALCAYNRLLGELTLDGFTPGPATLQSAIRVVLRIDRHGILHAAAEVLAKHKDIGRRVKAIVTLDTDVAHSSADGTEASDCYTAEAKAEDTRIWAAGASRNRLRDLILKLREQRSSNNCCTKLQQRVDEAWAWWNGLHKLAPKEEYDKRYAELERFARKPQPPCRQSQPTVVFKAFELLCTKLWCLCQ